MRLPDNNGNKNRSCTATLPFDWCAENDSDPDEDNNSLNAEDSQETSLDEELIFEAQKLSKKALYALL